ncbi:lytic murein transglycosylase [Neorhizobium galegae]|uniref:Lytic murein transglycosylase n=1 Tax=Neorhizobium galegae TaxID=399 RepID=A0A6A1U0Z4_NEOGA|nr:lytic murein transglycosylase [Neorhizobium galegae]
MARATQNTPLCPAGHLPLKGGDWQDAPTLLQSRRLLGTGHGNGSISPLEGEVPGRAEGGDVREFAITPQPPASP